VTVCTKPPLEFISAVSGGDLDDFDEIGQHLFDLIRGRCNVKPGDHILDIGSGCGRVAIPFTSYLSGGKYDGFDVVLPMVEWCREYITSRYPNFQFNHADLSNTLYSKSGASAAHYVFPYADNMFDVVFATSVFTHLMPDSAIQYAKETARVLKPTGLALLTFFILNDNTRAKRAAGIDIVPFKYNKGDYSLESEENPEAVIAFEQPKAFDMLYSGGLMINDFSPGQWSKNQGWTFQDAFLVSKR